MAPPAIFEHCQAVYEAMAAEAKDVTTKDGDCVLVYEGYLTKLVEHLGLAVPYYTWTLKELRRMDCVRQLRRGGGTAPSQWILLQPPTEELFWASQGRPMPGRAGPVEQLQQQVRDLSSRVARLEGRAS